MTEPVLKHNIVSSGTNLGGYQVMRLIGRGGMSEVYEAAHLRLKKRVAIKILRPDMAARDDMRARFLMEGEAAARIVHPNVVDITDIGTIDGLPYLVMEYLDGEDLGAFLDRHGPIGERRLVTLLMPVIAALSLGHRSGVVHRDLKPENIFLARGANGRIHPKILDFGVSRLMDQSSDHRLTMDSDAVGTPHFMSPEQARADLHVDGRSDQYSLGVMLYLGTTGVLPRVRRSLVELLHAIAFEEFRLPREAREKMSGPMQMVVERAMQKQPGDRFDSVTELGEGLLELLPADLAQFWRDELKVVSRPSARRQKPFAMPAAYDEKTLAAPKAVREATDGSVPPVRRPSSTTTTRAAQQLRSNIRWAGFGFVALVVAVIAYRVSSGGPASRGGALPVSNASKQPDKLATYVVDVHTQPPGAKLFLGEKAMGKGHFRVVLPRDGRTHQLFAKLAGYQTVHVVFRDAAPPGEITLSPLAHPAASSSVGASGAGSAPSPLGKAPFPAPTNGKPTPAGKASNPAPGDSPKEPSTPANSAYPRTDNRDPWAEPPP